MCSQNRHYLCKWCYLHTDNSDTSLTAGVGYQNPDVLRKHRAYLILGEDVYELAGGLSWVINAATLQHGTWTAPLIDETIPAKTDFYDGTPPARDAAGADTPGEVPHARGTEGASVWDGPDRVGPAGRLGEDARPWKRGSTHARPAEGGELDPHFCPCCRFWLSGLRQWEERQAGKKRRRNLKASRRCLDLLRAADDHGGEGGRGPPRKGTPASLTPEGEQHGTAGHASWRCVGQPPSQMIWMMTSRHVGKHRGVDAPAVCM